MSICLRWGLCRAVGARLGAPAVGNDWHVLASSASDGWTCICRKPRSVPTLPPMPLKRVAPQSAACLPVSYPVQATVSEALHFSATLRLPSTVDKQTRTDFVEEVGSG